MTFFLNKAILDFELSRNLYIQLAGMSDSYVKNPKFGDKKIQEVGSQFPEEDMATVFSKDIKPLLLEILPLLSNEKVSSLLNLAESDMNLEKCVKHYDKIVRVLQIITKEHHLVRDLSETEINDAYERVCFRYQEHALGLDENPEVPYAFASESFANKAASKILSMIRDKIQLLRRLEKRDKEESKYSSPKSVSMCVNEASGHAATPGTEITQSKAYASDIQFFIESSYNLELTFRLIIQNYKVARRIATNMTERLVLSSSSWKNIHVDVLKALRMCILIETRTLKKYIDDFLAVEASSASTKCGSVAEGRSDDVSVETEIKTISSSESETKDKKSLQTKTQDASVTAAAEEKLEKLCLSDPPEGAAHIEMKDLSSDSAQELLDSPAEQDSMRIPLLGSDSETANPLQYCPELTLCRKSTQTDIENENRSTGPCVTEETVLSTPDDDTGRSISSLPLDSASFHSSIPDEQLDSDTEETPL